jgi:hypothetical protein
MMRRPGRLALAMILFTASAVMGQGRAVDLTGGRDSLLADTTIARIWKNLCGGTAPKDSAIVYGIIRDAKTRAPVGNAYVDVVWTQLIVDDKNVLHQRRVKLDTKANRDGVFGICGLPAGQFVRMGAGSNGRLSALIDLPPTDQRLRRRDLMIGADRDDAERGLVFGTLREVSTGAPLVNARIVIDDSVEARTDDEGRFILRNVPTGTRQLEVLSIGMVPVVSTVDVFPSDSTPVALMVRRVTALDAVKVTASPRARAIIDGLEERRKLGGGYLLEAGEIYAHSDLATVFQEFPSARVERKRGEITVSVPQTGGRMCTPDVWVDGARSAQYVLSSLRMSQVVAVEMYPRAGDVPVQFQNSTPTHGCGVILLWTTWAFSR